MSLAVISTSDLTMALSSAASGIKCKVSGKASSSHSRAAIDCVIIKDSPSGRRITRVGTE